jgi:hypothetical protein
MLPRALAAGGSNEAAVIERNLHILRQHLSSGGDRSDLAREAGAAARALETAARELATGPSRDTRLDSLLDALLHPRDNRAVLSWDQAAQLYLGLAAAVNASNDRASSKMSPEFQQRVRSIARQLRFPGNPRLGTAFDSPADFHPERIRRAFQDLRSSTSP